MQLTAGNLGWAEAVELSQVIREADRVECPSGPFVALTSAMSRPSLGQCWTAITPDGKLLGAFGWTAQGTIWSLWRDLNIVEAIAITRNTPEWVANMVEASGREFLFNFIDCDNLAGLKWLRSSHCFVIDSKATLVNGRPSLPFRTKLQGAS